MKDERKTKKQLISEINELRKKVSKLERICSKNIEISSSGVLDVLESSINGVIITGLDGTIAYSNSSFLKMFGYEHRNEVVGSPASKLFVSEEVQRFSDVEVIIDKEKGDIEEFTTHRKDGSNIYVKVSSTVITDIENKEVARMASFEDITAFKMILDELNMVYCALDSTINGVIITSLEGYIVYANPALLRMFEFNKKEEVVGKQASDLFFSEQVKKSSDISAIIDKVKGETEEFIAISKYNSIFNVEVSTSIVTDRNGKDVGRMASFEDLMYSKKLENSN
ncbi:PAS domain-containing protein [candidate division KSB1 bacterium]